MTKRMLFGAVALVLGALTLAGCDQQASGSASAPSLHAPLQYSGKASYFDGAVSAAYFQNRSSHKNDYISLAFYAPGTYIVTFSTPPGSSGHGADYMPANFTQEITAAGGPREIVLNQYVIPDYVRITIVRTDGKAETHDFD
jgi:hypothetical protein